MSNAIIMAMFEEIKSISGGIHDISMFSDGSDGDFNSAGNITFQVPTDDTDYIVKNYKNFTLNAGHTLTINKRNKGLVICCTGNMIINGTIDMNDKAARVLRDVNSQAWEAKAVVSYKPRKLPLDFITDILPVGGDGGNGGKGGGGSNPGGGGSGCAFGGSGGGGGSAGGGGANPISYGGGGGGAGNGGNAGSTWETLTATPGGIGAGTGGSPTFGGSSGGGTAGTNGYSGGSGGGGLILLMCKGNITIGSSGKIIASSTSTGGSGGSATGSSGTRNGGGGGGGAGGGVIFIGIRGMLTNNGIISVNGGLGGSGGSPNGASGQAGQIGTIIITEV